jgi:ABC-type glycerol-3-phosphate transport system substrate-binding protein
VVRAVVAALGLALVLAGCGSAAPATSQVVTVTAQPAAAPDPSAAADRAVCIDFDARGGTLYNVFVVPMMKGANAPKSINVNAAQLTRAAASVEQVGQGQVAQASPAVGDAAQRLVSSAGALDVYEHADSTALLTSFVTLAVECQKAGHKPSWFDAESLAAR